jgi:hypothetical protein
MAFMYVLIGIALVVMAIASAIAPSVRLFEDRIPDHIEPEDKGQNPAGDPLPNPIGD